MIDNTSFDMGVINFSGMEWRNVCEINQLEMINQLEKIPSSIFWVMLLSFLSLVIYIFLVPRLKGDMKEIFANATTLFSAGTLLFALIFQAALTFNITASTWKQASTILTIIAVIIVLIVSLLNRKKIIGFLNKVSGDYEKRA